VGKPSEAPTYERTDSSVANGKLTKVSHNDSNGVRIEETKEAFTGFESPVRSADLLEVARNENTENQRTILLTEAQRGLWMLSTMNLDALRAYNLSLTLRLRGPYDHAKMLRALQGLIDRHEALRTQMNVEGRDTDYCGTSSHKRADD